MRIITLLLLLKSSTLVAQLFPPASYPQGYFRNPLAIPMRLAGNFGELRPNHYHMGFDVKTNARENLPVYAAADGYISRIKIEPYGFGRAIYINHPNGFTTLYAHLNTFNPTLEKWVKDQQYEKQSWKVLLELPADLFPVKKGDFLAYSGNTGGSQAPHLHFEIRRTDGDVNVNPFLFGFPVADNVPPKLLRLAVYDRTRSVYEQSPRIFPVRAISASTYMPTPAVITVSSPLVSFAIGAYDTQTGSSNLNGIYESTLLIDEEPVIGFRMDNISYNDTRDLNAHIDYKTKYQGGPYLQHLAQLPGYTNSVYRHNRNTGAIDLSDGAVHAVSIKVKDASGNTSTLNYKIQYNGADAEAPEPSAKKFYPLMMDGFESPECEFYIGERCLYDSVHIRYNKSANTNSQVVSSIHTIGAPYIPLRDSLLVRIQPNRTLTDAERSRTVMQWFTGTKEDVQKVQWQGNWASARFRDFGNYQLVLDTQPPVIVPIGFTDGSNLAKATRIAFTVNDNLEKYKNVRAELDGQWLRFTNDKGKTFLYFFDEKFMSGRHELMIHAEDEAGNVTERTFTVIR
ncbi:M23 family metallopeptidase [Longitalea luteola]|uniref:M23 family metallopeptidase n=1 Tax=Longitalea luteola TaxID=2812563 RepID=UPI001A960C70|nr:M23 family metallopeptidase [Longitalea luteola]